MELDEKANIFIQKIKHFLIINIGKTIDQVTDEEFYLAFSFALREEIIVNWIATLNTFQKLNARIVYYLSLEYLPGRHLGNNITNIAATDLVRKVLQKMNRNYQDLLCCEPDPGLGNGGLGRLASCFLDALAAQQYPAWGYGLRYQYGIFEQEIWDGNQIERPDIWLLNQFPWEFRRDSHATNVNFCGQVVTATNSHGEEVYLSENTEELRALPFDHPIIGYPQGSSFSVLSLRLWSTKESPRNFELQRYNAGQLDQAGENTSLTDVLYPNDHHDTGKRIRLKQEFLLVSASLQDILKRHMPSLNDPKEIADKVRIQINDTHPALIIAELMHLLTLQYDISWKDAWEITQTCCSYTNHTILREALEEWNEKRVSHLLPKQYRIIQRLNQQFCDEVRSKYPQKKIETLSLIENGQVRMAHLCIIGSHKVNGVAKLHGEILKEKIFPEFSELYPGRFISITNGITHRRWLLHANPGLAELITKRIGEEWITDFQKIAKLADFASDQKTQEEFLEVKKKNKERLFHFLIHENPLRDEKGQIIGHSPAFDTDALVDVQIKRIHEYKRPLLNLLHLLALYQQLKTNQKTKKLKRLVVIGGKAAPGYFTAKETIRLIYAIARLLNNDEETSQYLRIVFIENYNVSKAEIIIPAADLSQQISTAGKEASGTGNMKLAVNGALTLATEDGANIEMHASIGNEWWPFLFGGTADEIAKIRTEDTYKAREFYSQNEILRQAVDKLKDRSLAKNDEEHKAFTHLYQTLLEDHFQDSADKYFVLKDFKDYYQAQQKVEELFLKPLEWAKFALHNIAGMGKFSADECIHNYCRQVWNIEKCPPHPDVLKKVEKEFSEHKR